MFDLTHPGESTALRNKAVLCRDTLRAMSCQSNGATAFPLSVPGLA